MGLLDPLMPRRAFAALSAAAVARLAAGGRASAPGTAGADAADPGNVRVSDDGFTAHIEPAVAADPRDPRRLLAACRVFQGSAIGVATYSSFDAGRSWHSNGLLPGVVPDFDGNATVAFDGAGRGYVCAIRATSTKPRHGDGYVWRTDDGGRHFAAPVTALAGGSGLADHPWLVADQRPHAGPGRLYIAARMFNTANDGVVFTRSLDGGHSFESPLMLAPATPARTATLPVAAIGPDGTLCVLYLVVDTSSGAAVLRATRSIDAGATFATPVDLARATDLSPDLGNVSIRSGVCVAASPDRPHFYATMTTFDDATETSSLLLIASADGARTWGPPLTLAQGASGGQTIYLQPQVAVDARGRIGVSVYALSLATASIDVLLHISEPGRTGFGPPRRVTTRPFDPRQAVSTGSSRWLGNYQALTATRDLFHPMWTDTRTGDTQIFTATEQGA